MNMKLRKLDINGVGGIKKLELSFRDNLNVICGENGIGKKEDSAGWLSSFFID